jgi:hypothetical protein
MRRAIAVSLLVILTLSALAPGAISAQGPDERLLEVPNRISFTYSTQIAQDAVWQWVPESKDAQTPTGPVPEYTAIRFQDYSDSTGWADTGQFINVYPVMTFPTDSNQPFAQGLQNLRAVLAARPNAPAGNLPMLPIVTASQILRSQVQYLDFPGGSGIRYVTAAGLDVSPLSESALFYTFQGLTSDGGYYIAGVFPVMSGLLPATPEPLNSDQYNQFAANYPAYIADLTQKLDGLAPQSFSPDLTLLDRLFQSLKITAPVATMVTPADATTADVAYQNVFFSYAAALASRVEVDEIAPVVDTGGMTMFGSQPGYSLFTLIGYPVTRQYGGAQVMVFPVSSFPNSDSISDQVLARLQAFLAARAPLTAHANTSGGEGIPVLPLVNAAQVIVVKPQYFNFQDGFGVRFITSYGQDISPITNDRLLYVFEGMTTDGQYVVSVQFPVKASILPDTFDPSTFDYNQFMATYADYMATTVNDLDLLQSQDYTPNLDTLDALIQSIQVGP